MNRKEHAKGCEGVRETDISLLTNGSGNIPPVPGFQSGFPKNNRSLSHPLPGPQKRGTGGTLNSAGKSHRDRGHPPASQLAGRNKPEAIRPPWALPPPCRF